MTGSVQHKNLASLHVWTIPEHFRETKAIIDGQIYSISSYDLVCQGPRKNWFFKNRFCRAEFYSSLSCCQIGKPRTPNISNLSLSKVPWRRNKEQPCDLEKRAGSNPGSRPLSPFFVAISSLPMTSFFIFRNLLFGQEKLILGMTRQPKSICSAHHAHDVPSLS